MIEELIRALGGQRNEDALTRAGRRFLQRHPQVAAIARRLAAEPPDYLVWVTNLVPYLISEGKLAEAQALIDPLLPRKRMHIGKFGAVATAQVSVFFAEGKEGNLALSC